MKDSENKQLEMKVKEMVKERDDLYTSIGERDMLYEDLKERMQIRYGFDSNDEESESDEEVREIKSKKCDICEFVGKTESGLKTHITKKHREK